MWPKPSRKKGKSQGTKSKLKAIKEEKSESSPTLDSKSGKSGRRKTRPPNRNRKQRSDLEETKPNDTDEDQESLDTASQKEPAPKSESGTDVWKDRILKAYKGSPRDSAQLLAMVPNQRAQFEAGERQKQELIEESMIKVVDRMFDNFQNTAYGFNQVTQGSDLELTWIRPSLTSETQGSWAEGGAQGMKVFSGRISTRYWTLVVRGTERSVSSYIFPSDKLLSFGTSAINFDPYAELKPVSNGMAVVWYIKDKEITQDIFPSVFRALLDGLIRFANEEAEPNEEFMLEDIGFVPEASEQEEEPSRFEADDDKDLLGPEMTMELPEPDQDQESELELEPKPQVQAVPSSPRPQIRNNSIEQAVDKALDAEEEELSNEPSVEELVDPGAGFIQSVSSKVAYEASQEMDLLRESIKHKQDLVVEEEKESMETGQWKMVSSNLPPAVASQWQNYVKKTSDLAHSQADDDDGSWNVVPDTDNLAANSHNNQAGLNPSQIPHQPNAYMAGPDVLPSQDASGPNMGANSIDNQSAAYEHGTYPHNQMPPGQLYNQTNPSGWVHPSQQQFDQSQYGHPPANPTSVNHAPVAPLAPVPPVKPAPEPAFNPNFDPARAVSAPGNTYEHQPPNYQVDDEETIEFQTPSEHSQYLLTKEDIDDRAIQAPPPDPRMTPSQMLSRSMDQSSIGQGEEEVDYREGDYLEDEEEVEYETEEETVQFEVAEGDLSGVLYAVMNTIDLKVENLSQKGAQAFSNKDFKRAEVIIKLSERLNEFKEEANQLLSLLDQEEDV